MTDFDAAMKLLHEIAALAPYPDFVKAAARASAEGSLRRDPQLAGRIVSAARDAVFPCGHASKGCPACPAIDHLADGALPQREDPKEVGERVASKLRNLK